MQPEKYVLLVPLSYSENVTRNLVPLLISFLKNEFGINKENINAIIFILTHESHLPKEVRDNLKLTFGEDIDKKIYIFPNCDANDVNLNFHIVLPSLIINNPIHKKLFEKSTILFDSTMGTKGLISSLLAYLIINKDNLKYNNLYIFYIGGERRDKSTGRVVNIASSKVYYTKII